MLKNSVIHINDIKQEYPENFHETLQLSDWLD
jgi:hypothetical protein